MKRKRQNWDHVPWTEFQPARLPDGAADRIPDAHKPHAIFLNSRYQVTVWLMTAPEPFGEYVHLSIKTLDRQARHDWRDMQRIKNELCGPEFEGVEVFPAESRLVDTANQYHLFVFKSLKLPFGFTDRLVAEGSWENSKQRPFDPDVRPADLVSEPEFKRRALALVGDV
jgi:hypothetical protein